ncbi:MAG: hypothetical protein CMH55_01885 [Myxococcales bacterium]|nr:hypothetical protein [Myxococcales bacterium]
MNRPLAAFLGGVIFAVGLGISGMTDANKVIGFLNLAGPWDPSLAFVMVGGIGVHLALYRLILRRESPLLSTRFHLPTRRDITPQLVGGAALFGIGWGAGGFCPGPGIVSVVGFCSPAVVFVLAMIGGMGLHRFLHPPVTTTANPTEAPS